MNIKLSKAALLHKAPRNNDLNPIPIGSTGNLNFWVAPPDTKVITQERLILS